ncbi:MAG: hypothetical protein KJ044_09570, partial [Planctomycetes bacterium]|nr:hypothetical protein [Planctomycetota bacterium]
NTLLWWRGFSMDPTATWAPGNQELLVYDMAVAANGDLFIVGCFAGTVDFDPGPGQANTTASTTLGADAFNAFLVKLDTGGNFQWVRHWQGNTEALTVCVAPGGNIYVSGTSEGGPVDLNPGAGQQIITELPGNYPWASAWVCGLDNAGNYLWGHYLTVDTTATRQTASIEIALFFDSAVDSAGNLILGGYFGGSMIISSNPADYDPNELVILTEGTPRPRFVGKGNTNMLVVSYDPAGNRRWLRHYGTELTYSLVGNLGWGVAVDDDDSVYFTGGFCGRVSFDPPTGAMLDSHYNPAGSGRYVGSIMVQKLDSSGNHQWVHGFNALNATNNDMNIGKRVIADSTGVVLGGIFCESVDLDPSAASAVHNPAAGHSFLAKYNKQGQYQWSVNFGSSTTTGWSQYPGSDINALSLTGAHRLAVGGHFNVDFLAPGPTTQQLLTPYNGQATSWIMTMDQTSLHAPLQIDQTSLAPLSVGQPVVAPFTASGGSQIGLIWSISQGSLPSGVSLSSTAGPAIQVVGMATQTGMGQFELTVQDDLGNTASRAFQWVVASPPLHKGGGGGSGGGGCTAAAPRATLFALLLPGFMALRRRKCQPATH